jgi:hypothetical protein
MRVGGGGREQWMVILPIAGLFVLTTVLLGGPEDALSVLEHTFYSAWDAASVYFRR